MNTNYDVDIKNYDKQIKELNNQVELLLKNDPNDKQIGPIYDAILDAQNAKGLVLIKKLNQEKATPRQQQLNTAPKKSVMQMLQEQETERKLMQKASDNYKKKLKKEFQENAEENIRQEFQEKMQQNKTKKIIKTNKNRTRRANRKNQGRGQGQGQEQEQEQEELMQKASDNIKLNNEISLTRQQEEEEANTKQQEEQEANAKQQEQETNRLESIRQQDKLRQAKQNKEEMDEAERNYDKKNLAVVPVIPINEAQEAPINVPEECLTAENMPTEQITACNVLGLDQNFINNVKTRRKVLKRAFNSKSLNCHTDKKRIDPKYIQNIITAKEILEDIIDKKELAEAAEIEHMKKIRQQVDEARSNNLKASQEAEARQNVIKQSNIAREAASAKQLERQQVEEAERQKEEAERQKEEAVINEQINKLKKATYAAMSLFEISFNKTFFQIITIKELTNRKDMLLTKLKTNQTKSENTLNELVKIVNEAYEYLENILDKLNYKIIGTSFNHLPLEKLNEFYNKLSTMDRNLFLEYANPFLDSYKKLNYNKSAIIIRPKMNETRKNQQVNICRELGQLNPIMNSQRGIPSVLRKLTRKVTREDIQKPIKARMAKKETSIKEQEEKVAIQGKQQLESALKSTRDAKTKAIEARIAQLSEIPENEIKDINAINTREKELMKLRKQLQEPIDVTKKGGDTRRVIQLTNKKPKTRRHH